MSQTDGSRLYMLLVNVPTNSTRLNQICGLHNNDAMVHVSVDEFEPNFVGSQYPMPELEQGKDG